MPRAATASDADASLVLATNSKTDKPRSSVPEGASPRFDTEVSPTSRYPTQWDIYPNQPYRINGSFFAQHHWYLGYLGRTLRGLRERGRRRARLARTLWRERGPVIRLYFSASLRFAADLQACSVFAIVACMCRRSEFLKACSSRFHVRVFSASSGHLAWLYQ